MPAKIFIDAVNYPQVANMVTGQRLTLTLSGKIEKAGAAGINFVIEGLKIGKKGKMSTTEVLLANRLDRIEEKLPGQAVAM
jgi:hypothetical protein